MTEYLVRCGLPRLSKGSMRTLHRMHDKMKLNTCKLCDRDYLLLLIVLNCSKSRNGILNVPFLTHVSQFTFYYLNALIITDNSHISYPCICIEITMFHHFATWLEINHFIVNYVLSLLIVKDIICICYVVIFIIINVIFLMQGCIGVSGGECGGTSSQGFNGPQK